MDHPLTHPAAWRGPVNSVLYAVPFASEPDRATARELADAIRADRVLRGGPALYRTAIREALAQGDPVTGEIPTAHPEATIRVFLQGLHDTLGDPRT